LGLNYTKKMVEAHHGTIEVNSTVGEGSSFTVRIPLR
ncbi:MAG: ATP-binding protein, partial [Chitinophagaceae bacterium]